MLDVVETDVAAPLPEFIHIVLSDSSLARTYEPVWLTFATDCSLFQSKKETETAHQTESSLEKMS